jgi:hypothetical protein
MRKIIATATPFELLHIPGFSFGHNITETNQRSLFHKSTGVKAMKKQTTSTDAAISPFEALAAAQEILPDDTIVSLDTKNEHGKTLYTVCFSDGTCVDIRASDGHIIRRSHK